MDNSLPPRAHLRPSTSFSSTTALLPPALSHQPIALPRTHKFNWLKAIFLTITCIAIIGTGACAAFILLFGKPVSSWLWTGLAFSLIFLVVGILGLILERNKRWESVWRWVDKLGSATSRRDEDVPTLHHHHYHHQREFELASNPIHRHPNHPIDIEAQAEGELLALPTRPAPAPPHLSSLPQKKALTVADLRSLATEHNKQESCSSIFGERYALRSVPVTEAHAVRYGGKGKGVFAFSEDVSVIGK